MLKKFQESEILNDGSLLVKLENMQEEELIEEDDWLCSLFDWLTWPLTIAMSAGFAAAGWILCKLGLRSRFKEWADELVG